MRTIQPQHRDGALCRAVPARHRQGADRGPLDRRRAHRAAARARGFGLIAADTDLVAWLVEVHLVMSTVAQSRDLSDRKTIENFAAVVQSLERMKLLTILTTADIRAVGPGRVERLEGAAAAHALLRDRAGRSPAASPRSTAPSAWPSPRPNSAPSSPTGRRRMRDGLYRAALSGLLAQGRPAAQARACALRARRRDGRQAARDQRRLRCGARRHRAHDVHARPSRGCSRSSPAPARWPAPTSSTRRSTPPPTGSRSTPSRSRASSSATRTKRAAPRASAT